MKVRLVSTVEDADSIIVSARDSAERALARLRAFPEDASQALHALWSMKVAPIGCDPLDAEQPLNLIEQLNQTFTYIASARAAKILLSLHPDATPFTLNLGTAGGSDIVSESGAGVAAEVFAAVTTKSNGKLAKDMEKVRKSSKFHKYVFFMCPGYETGRQQQLEKHFGVQIWAVGEKM